MEEGCNTCQEAQKKVLTSERVITLDMSAPLVWGTGKQTNKQVKQRRRNLVNSFMKHVCALRNTGGGLLLVHFTNKVHQSLDLNAFSEMVDVRLNSMIEDDTLFVDNYERVWLEGFNDVLVLKVKSSSTCSTADFKTKIPLDSSLVDPTARSIPKLYSVSIDERIRGPVTPDIDWTQEFVPLYEGRNVQLKSFGVGLNIPESMEDVADLIWDTLKLKENITALAKILGGGSYFCGIEEVRASTGCYQITRSKVHGMELIGDERNRLENILLNKVRDEMLWTKSGNEENRVPPGEVDFKFHYVDTDVYVMEVVVGWFDGLVFYDRDGPECYEIQGDEVQHVDFSTWIQRVRNDPR